MTIGAGAGLSPATGLVADNELETFGESFGSGSEFASEVLLLSVAVASGCADFTGTFGCKIDCGLGEDAFIDGGAGVADVAG
jgi:hypothetical protein